MKFDYKWFNFLLVKILFLVALFLLGFTTLKGLNNIESKDVDLRSPYLLFPISLKNGWKYQFESQEWLNYDPTDLKTSLKLSGSYKLKKTFRIAVDYRQPTIVLGIVYGKHRVYLNGVFIGGADDSIDLRYYSFDKKILKLKTENELVVHVEGKVSLNTGINFVSNLGAFLDELSIVQSAVRNYYMKQQVFGSIYFFVLFAFFLFSLFIVFNLRNKFSAFYSSFIILLGTLNLARYNPWALDYFSYVFMNWIGIFSLILIPMLAFSAYLNLNQLSKLELVSNILTFMLTLSSLFLFNFVEMSPEEYLLLKDRITLAVLSISLVLFLVSVLVTNRLPHQKRNQNNKNLYYNNLFYVTSGVLSSVNLFSLLSPEPRLTIFDESELTLIKGLSLAFPIYFSVLYFCLKIYDMVHLKKMNSNHIKRNKVVLETFRLFRVSKDMQQTLRLVLENYCRYLHVNHISLFIFQGYDSRVTTAFTVNKNPNKFTVNFCDAAELHKGAVSYVVKNMLPVNIKNLAKDPRFENSNENKSFSAKQIKSCLLIPLISEQEVVGVLLVADKHDYPQFTHNDLNNAIEVSANLTLLLDSNLWHSRVANLKLTA